MRDEDVPKLRRTDEPEFLDPELGANLWSFPDIFQTARLLFYLHAAHPHEVPLRDVEIHFAWTTPYARKVVRDLKRYGYIEIIRMPHKRIYYLGTRRYKLTRRGYDCVQALLREATPPALLEGISP